MAVTRIKNNQITDSTITYAKIASGTLVGSNFNQNLTLNSNVTIVGNLAVSGNTSSLNSVNTYISDPLVVFNNGYTGSISNYEIGMVVNRNYASLGAYGAVQTAWVWVEADQAFEGIATTTSGNAFTTLTNSGFANLKVGNVTANSLTLSTGTITASGGIINTPISGSTGYFTTAQATNFSSGNVFLSGGYATGLANVYATLGQFTNFSTGNAVITGTGSYIGTGAAPIANVYVTTGYATNFSTPNLVVTAESVGTLVATNFSTANAQITGGTFSGITAGNFTTLQGTNFSSGNAQITGGTFSGITAGNFTTLAATNFSTGNAVITGAGSYIGSTGTPIANIQATLGTVTTLNSTTTNSTTLAATNFSTGNAVISGGYISALANATITTAVTTNFSTGNAQVTGGSATGLTNLTATTAQATNFSSGNAVISGAGSYIGSTGTPIANIQATLGTVTTLNSTTLAATNFSSGNARITGGYSDNHPIGANTAATGAFTTLTASGATTVTNSGASTSTSTGALVVTGGVGIGGNLWVGGLTNISGNVNIGGNLTVTGNSVSIGASTLSINDPIINLNTPADLTPLTVATTADIGLKFHYYDTADSAAFVGRAADTGYLEWYSRGSDTANVFAGTAYGTIKTGAVILANTQVAGGGLSANTGTLRNYGDSSTTGNVYIGGLLTASNISATLFNVTNFSTANAQITGGTFSGITAGNFTTLQGTNFSTGNAQITGGTLSGMTAGNFTTLQGTNFSSSNVAITGGTLTGISAFNTTTLQGTNFSTGNAVISGGYISALANATITTAVTTNFSTGNARITGGYADNYPIGANTAATGAFTTLTNSGVHTSNGNLVAASGTASTTTTTGALVVVGGIGASGNLNLGTNASLHNIKGNLLIGQGNVVDSADTILTVNLNTDTPILSNAIVHISGLSGSNAIVGSDSFGTSVVSGFVGRKARGTSAAPSAVQAGDQFAVFGAKGYGATGYNSSTPGMRLEADQNFTDTAMGTRIIFQTIQNGSTTLSTVMQLASNGAAVIPTATATTSSGSGALIVGGGVGVGGSLYTGANVNVGTTLTVSGVSTMNGNVIAAGSADSTSTTTGAIVVPTGGIGVAGNITAGKAALFNSSKTTGADHIIKGANDDTLIWARPNSAYDSVIIGNSATATTAVKGAKLVINSTDAFLMPIGTNAQRPSAVYGNASYDLQGMLRYNTTNNGMEVYNGSTWQSFTTSFTVIADQQFTGDGTSTAFTLTTAQTTASCIVSINGVLQAPTGLYGSAYSVSGTTLTFTEAPLSGDVIDVRMLTTTVTVTNISSANGFNVFSADNYGANIYTGSASQTLTVNYNSTGAAVGFLPNVSVASANTATTVDTVDTTQYRSAKYLVQVTNGANYQVMEALVISNGTTATITTYGTISTNGNLGVLSATQSGSNALVQFIAANATNNVRISKDYLAI